MRFMFRSALLAATILASAPGLAQQGATQEQGGIEDIIVTARKTEESLSDAPVAVSAVSDKMIQQLGLNSIDDFAKQATGISFSQAFGRSSDRPVIRGQSNVLANVQFGVETGAAYFVDGIYYQGDIQGFDPNSIQRVEIIKGPQSALYGRNTYSGAINYVTKDPADKLTVAGKASLAEHDTYDLSASVSTPILGDALGVSAGGRYYSYGGEYRNQLTGNKVGSEKSYSGYVTLVAKPNDDIKIRLRGQYQHDRDGPLAIFLQGADANNCMPGFRSLRYRQRNLPPPVPVSPTTTFQPAIGISNNANQYFCGTIQPQPNNVRVNTDPVATFFGTRDGTAFDGNRNDQYLASGIMDWDIAGSGWVLSSLTGFRDNTNLFGSDGDHSEGFFFLFPPVPPASTEPAFANTNRDDTQDFSQEIRLASPADKPIRGLIGGYYFKQTNRNRDLTFANPTEGEALGANSSAYGSIEDIAVFGLVSAEITDAITITGELRYAEERKTIMERASATTIFCAGEPGRAGQFGFTGTCLPVGKFKDWTPRITLDWKPSDDVLVYAVYAEGNKPGGFNGTGGLAATALTGTDQTVYLPETVRGGELGVKFDTADRKARFAGSIFYNKLADVQLTRAIPPTVAGQTATSIVTNQGDAETKGFELEMQAAPVDGFNVSLGVAYVDAKFTKGCDADLFTLNSGGFRPNFDTDAPPAALLPLCDITGKRMPLGSPWIVNGSMSYEHEIGATGLSLIANTSFSYEDAKYIQVDNLAKTGDAFLLNARLGIRNENWGLTLFGRNLTNEESIPLATRWFDYRYGNARRDVGTTGTFQGQTFSVETGAPRAFFSTLRRGRTFGIEGTFTF
ncbi:TonB-dependent receptor [Sphingomonas cavernae]|nr:TonB-dependent receptor [Sphingomonas cavernae]